MVDKEKLDLEIRLTAIEYLLINMGKAVYLTAQVPAEKMREMRESARTQLLGETFPGVDPSMGDHVGAELADRVCHGHLCHHHRRVNRRRRRLHRRLGR